MKNLEGHKAALAKIPKPTWKKKLFRTVVIAPMSLGIGYAIHRLDLFADFQIWKINQDAIILACILFAGYSAAGDVVKGFTGWATALVRDLVAAIKGK